MKRFLSFAFVLFFLCFSLLSLSSCGVKMYEICSKKQITAYIDVDPKSLDAGDIKHCKIFVCHEDGDGEPFQTFPGFISAYELGDRKIYLEIHGASGDGGKRFLFDPYSEEWINAGFWQ